MAVAAAASGVALRGRPRSAAALALSLAGGALSLGLQLEAASLQVDGEHVVEGHVREVRRWPGRWRVDLDRVVGAGGRAIRVRLRGEDTPAGLPAFEAALPGQRVRARVRLRPSRPLRNPGAPDRARADRRAGIAAVGRLLHPSLHARLPARDAGRWLAPLHRLRARIAERLEAAGPGGALLRALALGHSGSLPQATRDAFARLGVAHLLAVSGLHLALGASLAYAGLRRSVGHSAWLAARGDTRPLCLLGALCAATVYALLAGWGVPVRRALVLLAALAAGFVVGRTRSRAEPLAGAAIGILAFEPEALFAPGAQLSFAATAALLASLRRPDGASAGRVDGLLRSSATAFAATAPLAALQLGSRAPFALLANLVAVPWTGVALLPAALLSAGAAALDTGGPLIRAAERAAGWTLQVLEALAMQVPGTVGAPAPAPAWLAAATGLALVTLAARSTGGRVACAAAVGMVLHLAPAASLPPAPPRLVFLEVGQGDATLVQGRDAAVLVDAGIALREGPDLGKSVVVPALRALGVERLDLLVASHADLDHRGGLPAVLASFPVGALWIPRGERSEPAFTELLAAARQRGVPIHERGQGDATLQAGDLAVTPLWPPARVGDDSRNDRSLVLRIDVGAARVLLPGDLEAAGEAGLLASLGASGADLRADVLKLAHHGSRSSSTAAFLAAVSAELAVASAPCAGRFGMPHAEVLERAADASTSLWWTGRDGAVLVGVAPGGPIHAAGHGPPRHCPE